MSGVVCLIVLFFFLHEGKKVTQDAVNQQGGLRAQSWNIIQDTHNNTTAALSHWWCVPRLGGHGVRLRGRTPHLARYHQPMASTIYQKGLGSLCHYLDGMATRAAQRNIIVRRMLSGDNDLTDIPFGRMLADAIDESAQWLTQYEQLPISHSCRLFSHVFGRADSLADQIKANYGLNLKVRMVFYTSGDEFIAIQCFDHIVAWMQQTNRWLQANSFPFCRPHYEFVLVGVENVNLIEQTANVEVLKTTRCAQMLWSISRRRVQQLFITYHWNEMVHTPTTRNLGVIEEFLHTVTEVNGDGEAARRK